MHNAQLVFFLLLLFTQMNYYNKNPRDVTHFIYLLKSLEIEKHSHSCDNHNIVWLALCCVYIGCTTQAHYEAHIHYDSTTR